MLRRRQLLGSCRGEVVLTALKNGNALTITVPKVLFTSQQAVSGIVFKQFLFMHILS